MVQAGHDTGCNGWAYCQGYQFKDGVVELELGDSPVYYRGAEIEHITPRVSVPPCETF